jgi:Ca-activated chloride channel family protein
MSNRRFTAFTRPLKCGIALCVLYSLVCAASPAEETKATRIQATASSILVPVTVLDLQGRYIIGLEKANFRILEDGVEQDISGFTVETPGASIVIVAGIAQGSPQHEVVERALRSFLSQAKPDDEFSLVQFKDQPQLDRSWTVNVADIDGRVAAAPPGPIALLDGIEMAIQQLKLARGPRKAILVFSDGSDSSNSFTEERMRAITTSSEAPIYVISAIPSAAATTLGDIAEQSGGLHFILEGTELQILLRRVRVALGTGYRLRFEPKNALTNGAWRQIRVQVSLPLATPSLRVIAKIGYYAPTR